MGLSPFSSSRGEIESGIGIGSSLRSASKFDYVGLGVRKTKRVKKSLPNPDPFNYQIIKEIQLGKYLVLKIQYLDCTNYEGNKILVYKSTLDKLKEQKYIDPHFCDNKKFISPIARFVPNELGWRHALNFVSTLNK